MKAFALFLSLAGIFLLTGCGNNSEEAHFRRFEQLLFSAQPEGKDLYSVLKENESNYRFLFNYPLEDSIYIEDLKNFSSDTILREINDTVQKYYGDLSWLEKDMAKAVGNVKEHFPEFELSYFYTLIHADFDYFNRVLVVDSFLALSIDMYAVPYFQKYGFFGLPRYMANMLTKEEILPDCVSAIGRSLLEDSEDSKSLLEIMILRGKILYFMDKVIPNVSDHLKIRYNLEQFKWCEKNEALIWSYLMEKQLLYKTNFFEIRHLVNEGPATQGFEGAPARLGEYIGWQIVKKYMSKNSVSLPELFANTDAQKILSSSGYKPKRK